MNPFSRTNPLAYLHRWRKRRQLLKVLSAPAPVRSGEEIAFDDQVVAEIYASRHGYTVEWVSTEEWCARFNAIEPGKRIASLYGIDAETQAFIDPTPPYRKLVAVKKAV